MKEDRLLVLEESTVGNDPALVGQQRRSDRRRGREAAHVGGHESLQHSGDVADLPGQPEKRLPPHAAPTLENAT